MNLSVNWCVDSVVVKDAGQMDFMVSWTIDNRSGSLVIKHPDDGNRNMYLIDNLGQRHDHIITNGAAKLGGGALSGEVTVLEGVFVFAPAQPGATVFSFYDDDQHVVIHNINLVAPAP